jgi:hypothetical protein
LAEGLHDWGMRAVPLFSYTLAFALQLRKSTENLTQGSKQELTHYTGFYITQILLATVKWSGNYIISGKEDKRSRPLDFLPRNGSSFTYSVNKSCNYYRNKELIMHS